MLIFLVEKKTPLIAACTTWNFPVILEFIMCLPTCSSVVIFLNHLSLIKQFKNDNKSNEYEIKKKLY